MENAVDALKMGFAVLVFTIALSLAMYMFSKARSVSEIVLHSLDISEYMEYESVEAGAETRIVGLETIIPTLYKYYKEDYTVIFRKASGKYLGLYNSDTNLWNPGKSLANRVSGDYYNKYFITGEDEKYICYFDQNEEDARHEPWTGNAEENKKFLDTFLKGGYYYYPSGAGRYNLGTGFIAHYGTTKFKESIGEYKYNLSTNDVSSTYSGNTLLKDKKKRVIIYTKIS